MPCPFNLQRRPFVNHTLPNNAKLQRARTRLQSVCERGSWSDKAVSDNEADTEKGPCFELDSTEVIDALWESVERGRTRPENNTISSILWQPTPERVLNSSNGRELTANQSLGLGELMDSEEKCGRSILSFAAGMGKTLTLISLILATQHRVKKPTLIIIPSALQQQWMKELQLEVGLHGSEEYPPLEILPYFRNFTSDTTLELGYMQKFEVVITTFDILRSEYTRFRKSVDSFEDRRKGGKKPLYRGNFPLFTEKFGRVIVDEADRLRNAGVLLDAACHIQAPLRNMTTGTPGFLNNEYSDVYSIFRFLKWFPFQNHALFRSCFCLKEKSEKTVKSWKKEEAILNIERNNILHLMIGSISSTRDKTDTIDGKPAMEGRHTPVYKPYYVNLDPAEKRTQIPVKHLWEDKMKTIRRSAADGFQDDDPIEVRDAKNDPIFRKILKARRGAFHQLLTRVRGGKLYPPGVTENDSDTDSDQEAPEQANGKAPKFKEALEAMGVGAWRSKKASKIIEIILYRLKEDPKGSILVFSHWKNVLSIIQVALKEMGIEFVTVTGDVTGNARDEAMKDFWSGKIRVLLMTLQSGAVGLNLEQASTVIFCDPGWNPAIEYQAENRVDRMGQRRAPHIIRVFANDSIDCRALKILNKKRIKQRGLATPMKHVGNAEVGSKWTFYASNDGTGDEALAVEHMKKIESWEKSDLLPALEKIFVKGEEAEDGSEPVSDIDDIDEVAMELLDL